MPLPSKKGKESQSDFVSRCMSDPVMNKEFPKDKQRAAVCYNQYKEVKKSKGSEVNEDDWFEISEDPFILY